MSFYSAGNLKTEIIDPHYYNENDRVEFRLDRGTLMNNIKLVNLGVTGATATVYNSDAGVVSLIKNIHLYDGKVTLQSQFGANERYAFTQSLADNKYNSNVDKFLKRHDQGYAIRPSRGEQFGKTVESLYKNALGTIPAQDSVLNSSKGSVSILELLPILKVLPVLPSSVFKQLRLVIEFETDIKKIVMDTTSPVTTIKPSLVVDRFVNEQAEQAEISKLTNAVFMNYEKTRFTLDATPGNSNNEIETNKKIQAFHNKLLNRLRLQFVFANGASYQDGNDIKKRGILGSSLNFRGRKVQYRVNGQNVLPRSALEGDMRRLALHTDVYGPVNLTPEMVSGFAFSTRNGLMMLDDDFNAVKDFDSVYIGEMIEDLQITVVRQDLHDGTNPSQYKDALTCIVEGEVTKQINFSNGGYNVGYVSI